MLPVTDNDAPIARARIESPSGHGRGLYADAFLPILCEVADVCSRQMCNQLVAETDSE
jgi:hypothetical protein